VKCSSNEVIPVIDPKPVIDLENLQSNIATGGEVVIKEFSNVKLKK
jgi:hypothetical protein